MRVFHAKTERTQNRNLKAVILAAGAKSITEDGLPLLLQPLGTRKVIDYVMENVGQLVPPEDTIVVVGYQREAIQQHLGPAYHYVVQEEPLGTGHAVFQLQPLLKDFDGDLLILYGDTPLFRAASIRGLINRHRLRQANLTLLTAVADRPYPYDRSSATPMAASSTYRGSRGLAEDQGDPGAERRRVRGRRQADLPGAANPAAVAGRRRIPADQLGAPADPLRPAGGELSNLRPGRDPGHQQAADLEQVEFILLKRLFRPRREEERNIVQFGTGGWRAVIGEGFTLHNVRRLCQALANDVTRAGWKSAGC